MVAISERDAVSLMSFIALLLFSHASVHTSFLNMALTVMLLFTASQKI